MWNTRAVRALTDDDALALSPVWSPDDQFLYFSSSRGGTINIWRLNLATSEAVQVTAGQGDDVEIDLSRDGKRLIFSSYRANTNLAEISLEPGTLGQRKWLTKDLARSETAPRYSPDGQRIAYFTNRSGAEREGIWVMDADGGNATQLVEDDQRTNIYPRWSPDGQDLLFYSRVGVLGRVGRPAPCRSGWRSAADFAGEAVVSVLGLGGHRSRWTDSLSNVGNHGRAVRSADKSPGECGGSPGRSIVVPRWPIVCVCRARGAGRRRQTGALGVRVGRDATAGLRRLGRVVCVGPKR